MKPQTQILMIALAIAFAIALALTVALICISYVREGASGESGDGRSTSPSDTTAAPVPGTSISEELLNGISAGLSTEAPTEKETEPDKPEASNGLQYVSNGNGTCILAGPGTCTDACVTIPEYLPNGERVTEIAPRALFGFTAVTAIQIPASVSKIGTLAFADCKNLIYISVSSGNTAYCDMDGILYSADRSTLILYPALRAGSTVYLHAGLREIADMAFYHCAYLKSVSFAGDAEQWEQLTIGNKNYSLTAASKTFSSAGK